MNIPRLRITVPAFYKCPSHFQLIGWQPSKKHHRFRNYHSHHLQASQSLLKQSLSASSQPILLSFPNRHCLSRCRELNSFVSLMRLSCVVHRDLLLPIFSDFSHNPPMPSTSILSSVDCRMSSILSVQCDRNFSQAEDLDSHSDPSKLLSCVVHQSTFLGPYPTSSIHLKTNYLKRSLLRTYPNGVNVLRHISYTASNPSCISNFSSQRNRVTRPLVTLRCLSYALTLHPSLQPQSSNSCVKLHSPNTAFTPSRHFSLDGFYIALAQSAPVQTAQGLLLELHHWLPWWAVIAVATLLVRTLIVLPLAVHQAQVIVRLSGINAEMAKVAPELNKEVSVARRMFGWDEVQAKRVFKTQLRQIYQRSVIRDNCHPFKVVLLVAFQMPLWVCLSVSLRNLTAMAHSGTSSALELKSEGLLWFPDLTSPDSVFIPLLLLLVNLSLTEVHALRNVGKGGLLQKVMLNGSRVVIFFVAAAATINPSSVSFYWLCSSSFGLCQSLLLMSPGVRRSLGIPKMASESATPFQDVASNLRKRLRR